jgi:hypothetical protein
MKSLFHEYYFSDADTLNDVVVDEYRRALQSGNVRKTHLFSGRYENIYIDRERIPGLSPLITFWISSAAQVLQIDTDRLRCGFWFNEMRPGDVTLPHSHDDDDEWLSGAYYLKVPTDSGNLILHTKDSRTSITPEPGKLVLFSSSSVHEVEKNGSQETRLSVGINFGAIDG